MSVSAVLPQEKVVFIAVFTVTLKSIMCAIVHIFIVYNKPKGFKFSSICYFSHFVYQA